MNIDEGRGSCQFSHKGNQLQCRRFPPAASPFAKQGPDGMVISAVGLVTPVEENHWCGEYKPAKGGGN